MVLNIAEGAGLNGKSRRNYFGIALDRATETCTVLHLVLDPNRSELRNTLRRISAMPFNLGG